MAAKAIPLQVTSNSWNSRRERQAAFQCFTG